MPLSSFAAFRFPHLCSVAFSPDSELLAVSSDKGTVHVYVVDSAGAILQDPNGDGEEAAQPNKPGNQVSMHFPPH